MKNTRPSKPELASRINEIRAKAKKIGITVERLQVYTDTFLKTKDSQAAFEKATDGLEIKPGDEAFVRECFGGNPMRLLSK